MAGCKIGWINNISKLIQSFLDVTKLIMTVDSYGPGDEV